MNRRLVIAAAAAGFLISAAARPHEGHRHNAMGTVKAIGASSLELETQDGRIESFVLGEATVYKRGEAAAKREDVRTGERAAVVYETKAGRNLALEVRLAAPAPQP